MAMMRHFWDAATEPRPGRRRPGRGPPLLHLLHRRAQRPVVRRRACPASRPARSTRPPSSPTSTTTGRRSSAAPARHRATSRRCPTSTATRCATCSASACHGPRTARSRSSPGPWRSAERPPEPDGDLGAVPSCCAQHACASATQCAGPPVRGCFSDSVLGASALVPFGEDAGLLLGGQPFRWRRERVAQRALVRLPHRLPQRPRGQPRRERRRRVGRVQVPFRVERRPQRQRLRGQSPLAQEVRVDPGQRRARAARPRRPSPRAARANENGGAGLTAWNTPPPGRPRSRIVQSAMSRASMTWIAASRGPGARISPPRATRSTQNVNRDRWSCGPTTYVGRTISFDVPNRSVGHPLTGRLQRPVGLVGDLLDRWVVEPGSGESSAKPGPAGTSYTERWRCTRSARPARRARRRAIVHLPRDVPADVDGRVPPLAPSSEPVEEPLRQRVAVGVQVRRGSGTGRRPSARGDNSVTSCPRRAPPR